MIFGAEGSVPRGTGLSFAAPRGPGRPSRPRPPLTAPAAPHGRVVDAGASRISIDSVVIGDSGTTCRVVGATCARYASGEGIVAVAGGGTSDRVVGSGWASFGRIDASVSA